MAADRRNSALYIADYKKQVIHRLSVIGPCDQDEWPAGAKPSSLWVAPDTYQLLVSCTEARKLILFTPQGCVLREICLPSHIVAVHHAVTLVSGQIVASVGVGNPNAPLHRVSYIDTDGRVGQGGSGGQQPGFTVLGPAHLAAIPGTEASVHLIVGDTVGAKVVLLSATLCSIRVLATRNHGLRRVARLSVDNLSRRFYVADNVPDIDTGCYASGRVMVFSL